MRVFGRRFSLASLALPALLTLLLAACSTSTSNGGATATNTVAPSAQAREILAKAQAVKLKDATLKTHVTTKRGSQTVTLDGTARTTASPRRVEVAGTASLGIPYHAIVDGNVIYIQANDKWLKYTLGNANAEFNYDFIALITQLQNPGLVGTETINGAQTYHLRGTVQAPVTPGANQSVETTTEDLWVRQSDYYPMKIVAHGSGTNKGTSFTVDVTATFTAWNSGVTITPPTPDQVTTVS
jgi:LppX/LprAFG-like lipoprotein